MSQKRIETSEAQKQSVLHVTSLFKQEYEKLILEHVNQAYFQEFPDHDKVYDILVIFSKAKDYTIIELFPRENDASNSFRIDFEDSSDPQISIHQRYHKVQFTQVQAGILFPIGHSRGVFLTGNGQGLLAGSASPIEIETGGFCTLYNVFIEFDAESPGKKGLHTYRTHIKDVAFLAGTGVLENLPSFENEFLKAAQSVFQAQLFQLHENSENFRKALVHPQLSELAKRIQLRMSQAIKGVREYPVFEFERDNEEMFEIVKENNIDASYVDKIMKGDLKDQYKPIDGHLFKYYQSKTEFMIQWTFLNALMVALAALLLFLKPTVDSEKLLLTLSGILVVINAWPWTKLPPSLSYQYWILPGVLFLLSHVILWINPLVKFFSKD